MKFPHNQLKKAEKKVKMLQCGILKIFSVCVNESWTQKNRRQTGQDATTESEHKTWNRTKNLNLKR